MSDRETSLQELLSSSFQSQMNNVHTALPCVVVAVREDLEGMMVDIQPTINQKQKDGDVKERTVILGVPVSFQASSTAAFTFPIEVGTTGTAIFSMRNLDAWKNSNGRPSTPLNFAKFDKGDAIFLPGIQPPSVSVNNPSKRIWPHSTKDAVMVCNIGTGTENEVRLKANGDMILNTNQDIYANCNNLIADVQQNTTISTTNLTINAASNIDLISTTMSVTVPTTTWSGNIILNGNLTQTGAYTSTGVVTFNGIIFNTHDHIPGPGPSNP